MIDLNPANIFFTVLNVLVLFFMLKKFLFKPVMNVIDKRQEKIDGEFKKALDENEKAKALKADYEEKLKNADSRVSSIIEKARDEATKEKEAIITEAKKKSDDLLDAARKNIAAEEDKAKHEAGAYISDLAIAACEKILKAGGDDASKGN